MSTHTHATCDTCNRVMDPGVGCTHTHVRLEPEGSPWVKRLFVGEGDDWGAPVCPDCNAGEGRPHHDGCDVERCPNCGAQMLMCLGEPDEFGGCGWMYVGIPAK